MAKEIDHEVLLGFVDEARGYLPRILEGIDRLHRDPTDGEHLEETHRLTHSIKGAASMLGLPALANIGHLLEEALEQVAAGQLAPDADTAEVLMDTAATIGRYLDQMISGRLDERALITRVVTSFRRLRSLPEAGDALEIDRLSPPPATEGDPVTSSPSATPSTPRGLAEPDPPPDLLEAFQEEARDHLSAVGTGLRRLEKVPTDRGALDDVRRSVHTLKGAAAMVGLQVCADLAHRMEDLLDLLHEGQETPEEHQLHLLFTTADQLEDLVQGSSALDNGTPETAALKKLYHQYDELLGTAAGASPPTPHPTLPPLDEPPLIDLREALPNPTVADGPLGNFQSAAEDGLPISDTADRGPVVRVPIARLDEVVRLLSELVVSTSTFERHFQRLGHDVGEFGHSTDRLKRLSRRLDTEFEAVALSGSAISNSAVAAGGGRLEAAGGSSFGTPAWSHPTPDFDALELDRYTELHRISRQLGENTNDLNTLETGLQHRLGDFESYLGQVSRLTGEIQDRLMRLRMVPVGQLASRLHRTVRVTARQQAKAVDLVIEGEHTALDKKVLEEISDPLLHLLRNAVDHGLESPALRRVLGKEERGQIRLRAYHQGTQVVLEVQDDGGGLDEDRLRARAVEVGRLSESDAAEAPVETLHRLLFEPGFSTAAEVSEISGRGVGLDVVQSVVHRLEGTVTVRSQPGAGTTFTIRLPLTLAILRSLLVQSGEHTYALPLAPVRQILRLEPHDLMALGQEQVVRVRDLAFPAVRLSDVLGQTAAAEETSRQRMPVLILDLGERQIALLVDRIVEARDVVVKNLGTLLRQIPAITGATLMGDGRVVLILNPQDLAGGAEAPSLPAPPPARALAQRPLEVLVVDDSVSVRRVLSNLLRNQGWNPTTARDGLEALESLQRAQELPDVILLDIEMPRMDGYELCATLRERDLYREIPIVMLTSRAGEKHRRRAFEVGATEYLVKPYQDEILVQMLRRLTRAGGNPTQTS